MRNCCLAFLLVLSLAQAENSQKSCIAEPLTRGKELKRLLTEKDTSSTTPTSVLLVLQRPKNAFDDSDDESADSRDTEYGEIDVYEDLCKRLGETPEHRVHELEVALVTDTSFQKKLLAKAMAPPITTFKDRILQMLRPVSPHVAPSYPEYILFHQGNFQKGMRYPQRKGSKPPSVDDISEFLMHQVPMDKKLGSYVYSLGAYDIMAAKLARSSGNTQRLWAYTAWLMARMQGSKWGPTGGHENEATSDLVEVYLKTTFKVLENGEDYPAQQIERLNGMLAKKSNLSPMQHESMSQRVHVLSKFNDPRDYSHQEHWDFLVYTALNLGVWVGLLVLIPTILFLGFTATSEDEDGEDNEMKED